MVEISYKRWKYLIKGGNILYKRWKYLINGGNVLVKMVKYYDAERSPLQLNIAKWIS